MPRFGLMITDEIEEALKAENKNTGIPMSLLVRKAIEEFLVQKGYEFTTALEWGGNRRDDKEKLAGQSDQ